MKEPALWESLAAARPIELSHVLESTMPVSPNHPGFRLALLRRHGDVVRPDGGSAANEMMMLGGHSGTHLDALCHVSQEGHLFGNVDAEEAQRGGRFAMLGIETVGPIIGRGILLDIAALLGVERVEPSLAITAQHLARAEEMTGSTVREGDVVLIRTGWSQLWGEPDRFLGQIDGAPGPDTSAAQWLAERRPKASGAETIAYEHIPTGAGHRVLPVHRVLLVEHGIHIVEAMDLEALKGHYVFGFVMLPLRIAGATASPVRPVALVK